jgi:hypothetical protein
MTKYSGNYIVNLLPVKIINDEDGKSFDVLAYNFDKREFERNFDMYDIILWGRDDIKKVSEIELNDYINKASEESMSKTGPTKIKEQAD